LQRLRIGIHPISGFAERLREAHENFAVRLQALGVGDVDPDCLCAQTWHIVRSGEDADLASVQKIEAKRRRSPADVKLARQQQRYGFDRAAGRDRARLEPEFADQDLDFNESPRISSRRVNHRPDS
jgi:hypothetical protein